MASWKNQKGKKKKSGVDWLPVHAIYRRTETDGSV